MQTRSDQRMPFHQSFHGFASFRGLEVATRKSSIVCYASLFVYTNPRNHRRRHIGERCLFMVCLVLVAVVLVKGENSRN